MYEDAGRTYGAVCGQEIRPGNGGVAAGERPPLESSGRLSGEGCGGAEMFTTEQTHTSSVAVRPRAHKCSAGARSSRTSS